MDQKNDLENFRNAWKKELSENFKDKSDRLPLKDDLRACGQDSQSHYSVNTVTVKDSLGLDNSKVPDSLSKEKWYHPCFDNSLNDSTCDNTNDEKEKKGRCETTCTSLKSENIKRQITENKPSAHYLHFKKKKRLEDVFSDRNFKNDVTHERILDKFIADLDEITEIPFFDLSLPREVAVNIFKHLDLKDLCRCAQVSKSWRSLAEDELLWCNICHQQGFETKYATVEKAEWKKIVMKNILHQRQLVSNWKNRTGELTNLKYIPGGIVCSVSSFEDLVVTGYTNGEIKMWDLSREEDWVLQPSNSALIIDESLEEGTIANYVETVATSESLVAATYKQGNIDIWHVSEGSDVRPLHTISRNTSNKQTYLCVAKCSDTVVTAGGPSIHVHKNQKGEGFREYSHLTLNKWVEDIKIFEKTNQDPCVVIATPDQMLLHRPGEGCADVTEIHSDYQGVGIIDVRTDPDQSVCGDRETMYIHDLHTTKMVGILHGHSAMVTCVNLADSPPQQLVTGSTDTRVRVFDLRTDMPVMTFYGHLTSVKTVQMDDWKVVSGDGSGFVRVWDQRMKTKLWEWHNRYPVCYCHFTKTRLISGNVPSNKFPPIDEYDSISLCRYRGSVQVYDFTVNQILEGLPEICLSTYDEPEAYNYNIKLAMPYDKLWTS